MMTINLVFKACLKSEAGSAVGCPMNGEAVSSMGFRLGAASYLLDEV
ncbi:hypothetical protein [Mesorhizobium sp. M7A.T.Ca.TU.009.02.1.1]|nr:hypothetical protein [Mesorhizobium sp. M7A.T.Ca.TU.009.02.1.1]